jgi:hypothetical protein
MKSGLRRSMGALGAGVLALVLTTAATWGQGAGQGSGQSSGQSSGQGSSPASGQGSGQGASQGSGQGQAQAQDAPKDDSVAAASKKGKAKKPAKVYSEDDLRRLPGVGVSVIGQKPAPPEEAKGKGRDGKAAANKGENADEPEVKDEFYWRKRARKILDQLEAIDGQIEQAQQAARKPQPTKKDSDDPNAASAAPANDPKSVLQDLEKQKADLEKQLDALQEEGRRAGAPAAWFR